ncbi:MAG: hypothetical protein K6T81_09545 [Alicyclobacillus macrosporangiidus]|uniref:hypothetical protein n=1 Tax=Alicyclobacillus macrosporangiidus TaxID=392015 RepID=UPI0026F091BD|nr:hypothetical protein [Alicyclobacillus macrosporangiidus]MCL6598974.1 hypothetical protein [Alicyclobacillus macrosporangiidus]
MKYVVWVMEVNGMWSPLPAMSRAEADKLAAKLDAEGRSFRVVPAPRFDARED